MKCGNVNNELKLDYQMQLNTLDNFLFEKKQLQKEIEKQKLLLEVKRKTIERDNYEARPRAIYMMKLANGIHRSDNSHTGLKYLPTKLSKAIKSFFSNQKKNKFEKSSNPEIDHTIDNVYKRNINELNNKKTQLERAEEKLDQEYREISQEIAKIINQKNQLIKDQHEQTVNISSFNQPYNNQNRFFEMPKIEKKSAEDVLDADETLRKSM